MPLVKADISAPLHQSAIVMDLSDLERQAGQIMAEARRQAEQILAQAKAQAQVEAAQIREAARAAGHQEGFEAGHQEGQQKGHDEAVAAATEGLNQLAGRWSATLDAFVANMPTQAADVKADVVKLALAIASRVTKLEALRNKQVIQANVDAALHLVAAGRNVSITIHPDEAAVLEGYLPELLAKIRTVPQVELVDDPAITPGGCVLRYGAGSIDATLEAQLQRIAEELVADQQPTDQ